MLQKKTCGAESRSFVELQILNPSPHLQSDYARPNKHMPGAWLVSSRLIFFGDQLYGYTSYFAARS